MSELRRAWQAFLHYRTSDARRAAGQLRQAQFFITFDGLRFAPANRLLSWLAGIPFTEPAPSGRAQDRLERDLASSGLEKLTPADADFDTLFQALDADCQSSVGNRQVGSHYGKDKVQGKAIWRPASLRASILAAFDKYDEQGTPDGFRLPQKWFVAHPDTGTSYPAKIIYGLATGQIGADFNAHQARDALRRAGFEVADLSSAPPVAPDPLTEGTVHQATRNIRERNLVARQLCIDHYRTRDGRIACIACEFDFSAAYGSLGKGFIHVHHLDPLAEARGARVVSPEIDLVPVCPNCHAMIHRGGKNRSIAKIRKLLGKSE